MPIRHLDDGGRIPTRTIRRPGHLIANESFADISPFSESLARLRPIAPDWFIDFFGSPHEFAISVEPSAGARGLRITVARAARSLRLLTPLDPATIGSRTLRLNVSLRGSDSDERHPLIDGVYLVAMKASGKADVISRILGTISNTASLNTYAAEFETPSIDPRLDTFLCIQVNNECRSVDLESVSLVQIHAMTDSKTSDSSRSAGGPRNISPQSMPAPGRTYDVPGMKLLNPNSATDFRSSGKPRMAVICCNLGQNALGRAHTLGEVASREYEVELLGTLIPPRAGKLWAPLRDAELPIRGFVANDTKSLLSALRQLPSAQSYDVIFVSKPRFTGLLLGMVLSARCECPLVLDIDDMELAFLRDRTPLSIDRIVEMLQSPAADCDSITADIWTRFCDTLVCQADAITVCNEALKERFGGSILRHARDEDKFVRDEGVRANVRLSLGIREKEKVLFFLGTPRDHKGLERIAEAVVRRAEPTLTMCVMGAEERDGWLTSIAKQFPAFVRVFGAQPYARLPELIQCADAVCLLQDASSGISAFQSPAKMGEALAMGLPVLVSRVPPFAELIASGNRDPGRYRCGVANCVGRDSHRTFQPPGGPPEAAGLFHFGVEHRR